jgi:hypothetical protein
MTPEQEKELNDFIEQIESQAEGLKKESASKSEARRNLDEIHKAGGLARSKFLRKLFRGLSPLIVTPQIDLTKMIVAELGDKELQAKTLIKNLAEEYGAEGELLERLNGIISKCDQSRMVGIRILQAFVRVKPDLLKAMKELGVPNELWSLDG